jgi:hypothetical protein
LSANGSNPFHPSRRPLAAILPLFLRRVQLPIPLGLNLLLVPGEHVLWSDVADGTVQANVVVMLHITLYQAPCIFREGSAFGRERRCRWSDELRAIVGDDSRLGFQVLLLGSLPDRFEIDIKKGIKTVDVIFAAILLGNWLGRKDSNLHHPH